MIGNTTHKKAKTLFPIDLTIFPCLCEFRRAGACSRRHVLFLSYQMGRGIVNGGCEGGADGV